MTIETTRNKIYRRYYSKTEVGIASYCTGTTVQ